MIERIRSPVSFLTCPVCGKGGFKNLTGHIINDHKMSVDAFRLGYSYDGPLITKAQARLMAVRSNALWSVPKVRDARIAGIKKSYNENDLRERRRLDDVEQWNNSVTRHKREEAVSESVNKPGAQEERFISMIDTYRSWHSPMTRLREELYKRAGGQCERCGITEQENLLQSGRRLHLHHKSYDKTIPDLEDVELMCGSCHKEHHNEEGLNRFASVAKAVGNLLKALGVDLTDGNFMETPRRFTEYLLEHFGDGSEFEEKMEGFEEAVFPSEYDGMIIQNISAVGICPHHLLPVTYEGTLAYVPKESTIGLSKLSRIAQECLRLPILQEFGTLLVADALSDALVTSDVAVILRGHHLCMSIRGVKAHNSRTTTSELRGMFLDDPSARAEFMGLAMSSMRAL